MKEHTRLLHDGMPHSKRVRREAPSLLLCESAEAAEPADLLVALHTQHTLPSASTAAAAAPAAPSSPNTTPEPAAAAAASTQAAASSHATAAASSPAVSASSSLPFPAHILDAPRCLRERGFAFAPLFGEAFARDYIAHMGEDIAQRKRQRIAGEVEQFAMPQSGSSPWPSRLRAFWHTVVAELARHAGVDPRQLQLLSGDVEPDEPCLQLHVQDEKLLIAGRQKGEQAPHFDRDDTAGVLKQVYTVILYLTDGVNSTAFPQFALDEFALPEFDSDQKVLNAAALRATVERGCLNKERYDCWPVRVGDMAIFTQATMHFGTKNSILHERMALFSVLTPFAGNRQDDYQIYRWLYVGFAYGDQSRELAEALWRDREFEPLDRFSANSAGHQSHEAYISCLLRWGYIHWDPRAHKAQKLQWAPVKEHRVSPLSQQAVRGLFYGTNSAH